MKLIRLMQIKVIKERIEIFKNILDQCWRVRSTTAILGHLFQYSSLIGQHRSCEWMLSCDWSTSTTAALEMINQWLLHNFSNTFSQRKEWEKTKLNQQEESTFQWKYQVCKNQLGLGKTIPYQDFKYSNCCHWLSLIDYLLLPVKLIKLLSIEYYFSNSQVSTLELLLFSTHQIQPNIGCQNLIFLILQQQEIEVSFHQTNIFLFGDKTQNNQILKQSW